MKTKTKPKTTKSKPKPKRKPREWIVVFDIASDEIGNDCEFKSRKLMQGSTYFTIIKVREVIE